MRRVLPLLVLACWYTPGDAGAGDRVHWRGPEQNGVSREKDLPDHWSPDPKEQDNNLIWRMPYGGRSTPLVMGGRVIIINDAGEGVNEQERVMCFDADSGKVLWERPFNVFHTDIVSSRVGWSNLAGDPETGNVYAHGVQGLLLCFNKDGKLLWWHSLTEEYGRISGYGGRVTSPTVDGDLVIIGMVNGSWGDQARGANRFLALDKRTGAPVWWSQPFEVRETYYSCPVVTVINGLRLLITGGADGAVHALKVRTGEQVCSHPFGARAINSSPVVDGTRVYISHGEENEGSSDQGRVICLDAGQIKEGRPTLVWKIDGIIKAGFASPIIHEGRLYVCDDRAKLFCIDAETGKVLWKYNYGTIAKGSPVWADGKLYVAEVSAKFHILKPGPAKCEPVHKHFFRSPVSVVEINGSPAIVNGRIYFTTHDDIYCIGKRDHKTAAAIVPDSPAEPPGDPAAKPAHLQVVPADVVVKPGESVTFKARAFDAGGRLLREVEELEWSLPTPPPPPGAKEPPPALKGELSSGVLTVAKQVPGQQGAVLAKAFGLSARARVRVVPPLPIRQDFEKIPEGRVPAGWVNCLGKFVVQKKDGSNALKKLANNPNPALARANVFIGMPGLTDYTIQADLLGTGKKTDLPDMGLIANRYTLLLDGNKQRLRISSWDALPRVDKTIPWDWKPDVWYRAKLTVEVRENDALVRGKVWPRDQAEPPAWTVEFVDPTPNREGSPGLYGYATGILDDEPGTEIFYDNVTVTPNKK